MACRSREMFFQGDNLQLEPCAVCTFRREKLTLWGTHPSFLMRHRFWPFVHSCNPWSSQSFPSGNTAGVHSGIFTVEEIQFFDMDCCLFMRLHFSMGCYMTVAGHLEVFKSSDPTSFLFIMCIDAPVSTTNSLSSCLILKGVWRSTYFLHFCHLSWCCEICVRLS